jgi:hypothetical protein
VPTEQAGYAQAVTRIDLVAFLFVAVAAFIGFRKGLIASALSVAGIVALRRRGEPSFPLTVWVINVAITVVVFYGMTRFRAPAEPSLVLLGSVGLVWLISLFREKAPQQ